METFLGFVGLFILIIVFAWAARRLLGARRLSTTKTFLAAIVGFFAAWLVGEALRRARDLSNDTVAVVTFVLALVFTMFVLVAFEALSSPQRRPGRPRLQNPLTFARDTYASTRRSAEIQTAVSQLGAG